MWESCFYVPSFFLLIIFHFILCQFYSVQRWGGRICGNSKRFCFKFQSKNWDLNYILTAYVTTVPKSETILYKEKNYNLNQNGLTLRNLWRIKKTSSLSSRRKGGKKMLFSSSSIISLPTNLNFVGCSKWQMIWDQFSSFNLYKARPFHIGKYICLICKMV